MNRSTCASVPAHTLIMLEKLMTLLGLYGHTTPSIPLCSLSCHRKFWKLILCTFSKEEHN